MTMSLYQDQIVALSKDKTASGRLEAPDYSASLDNPLCGDRVTIDINTFDGKITQLSHHVRGCALCKASAALIARESSDKSLEEFEKAVEGLELFLKEKKGLPEKWKSFAVFEPVQDHKSRFDCVLLPLKALAKALP